MTSRPAARLRWGPACRRACATSEGGGRAECRQTAVRRRPGCWRLELGLETRRRLGEKGELPSWRLPEPGRRCFVLAGRLPAPLPGWPIGSQTRMPLSRRGGGIAHQGGRLQISRGWSDGNALGFGRLQSAAARSAVGAAAESCSTVGPLRRARLGARSDRAPGDEKLVSIPDGKA